MTEMTPAESNEEDIAREGRGRVLEDDIMRVEVKEKILTPTFVLLCVAVALNVIGLLGMYYEGRSLRGVAEDTNTIVVDIEEQNTPEAIAEREDALEGIILRVECAQRDALSDVFDGLVSEGLISANTVQVMDDRCAGYVPPSTRPR